VSKGNLAKHSAVLAGLFAPLTISAAELRGCANPELLLPEEIAGCEAFRMKRLEEFSAGRQCARHALGDVGFRNFPVRRNADRTPHWPEGVVGSITHTIGFCGAVVASREHVASVGIDAEIVTRVTPEIWSQVLTADDAARISALDPADQGPAAAVVFSAKEAFYKCQFAISGIFLDYNDVNVELVREEDDAGEFLVSPATTTARRFLGDFVARGRYRITDALALAGVAFTDDDVKAITSGRLRVAS